jgi:hypothetical protein
MLPILYLSFFHRETSMKRTVAAAFAFAVLASSAALAQTKPPEFACGGSPPQMIKVAPIPKFTVIDFDNRGADCAMWQTFFYLNWPVLAGQRGMPNLAAKFGTPGTTVWESFKTVDQVFLPNGGPPRPWNQNLQLGGVASPLAAQVSSGSVRVLERTSKFSRTAVSNIALIPNVDPTFLSSIEQAFGGTLWDQQKRPVYYEIAMNKGQFDYIVSNQLYSAAGQAAFIKTTNIALPVGSIEIKAAWKIMTPAEAASNRFHTTKAYIGPILQPVTVGLVGLHVFTGGGDTGVGLWGTFAHIDNAPVQPTGPVPGRTYTFFNAGCAGCPLNSKATRPTQVVQQFADDSVADTTTGDAWKIIGQYNKQNNVTKSPWLNYKLVNVQWSPRTVDLKTPVPIKLPLPKGMPSTEQMTNAVLETFMQQTGMSCLQCHATYANTAADSSVGSGYSFMFGYAQ